MKDMRRRIERGHVHIFGGHRRWVLVMSGAMYNATGTVYVVPVVIDGDDGSDGSDGCVIAISPFSHAVIDQITKVSVDDLGDRVFRLTPRQQKKLDRVIRTIFLANTEEQQR